jgi:hypothetical protein
MVKFIEMSDDRETLASSFEKQNNIFPTTNLKSGSKRPEV